MDAVVPEVTPEAPKPPDPLAPVFEELASLRTFKAQQEATAREAAARAEVEERQRLAEKGEIKTLLAKHQADLEAKDKALAERDARARNTERARAITAALSSKPLSHPTASSQLAKLWADDFEVVDGPNDTFLVRDKATLRPAEAVIAERLASADYSHFLKADSRGGSGAGGGANPLASPDPNAPPLTELQKKLAPLVPASGVAAQSVQGFGLRGRPRS